jgi:hypothetical protein
MTVAYGKQRERSERITRRAKVFSDWRVLSQAEVRNAKRSPLAA